MPGTTMPLSPHHTVFAMETHALSQCVTISMGQLTKLAGQTDTQHSQPDYENTFDHFLSFLYPFCLYTFCIGKLIFGANIGFCHLFLCIQANSDSHYL